VLTLITTPSAVTITSKEWLFSRTAGSGFVCNRYPFLNNGWEASVQFVRFDFESERRLRHARDMRPRRAEDGIGNGPFQDPRCCRHLAISRLDFI
jgi:hypothetical protein